MRRRPPIPYRFDLWELLIVVVSALALLAFVIISLAKWI